MHVFMARPTGGNNASCIHSQQHQLLLIPASLEMNQANNVARALNFFARDGFDMMGGADGAALAELLGEYLAIPGSDAHPVDSKGPTHYKYSFISVYLYCLGEDDDFQSHFVATQDNSKRNNSML